MIGSKTITIVVAIDVVTSLVFWFGAHLFVRPPETLPSKAPIVIFYSSAPDDLESRLMTAATAWHVHGPRPVLAVGGARPAINFWGSERMAQRLLELGIDGDAIRTDRSSYDTISNLAAARDLVPDTVDVVIVSDVLHLMRIRWLMRKFWRNAIATPLPTPIRWNPFLALYRTHYEYLAWLFVILGENRPVRLLKEFRA